MKKRVIGIALIGLLMLSVLAACGSGNGNTANNVSNGPTEGAGTGTSEVTIKIFNSKSEIVDQLNELKKEYEETHPGVILDIETVVANDYSTALKTKFAAEDTPDIFNNEGFEQLTTWKEHLEDLSDQPWVENVYDFAKAPMTQDGKIYGMPVNIEGYGMVYNKDMFEQAGITELPGTLTELKEAAAKIEATGVTPFQNMFQVWTSLGRFMFNNPVAKQPDPDAFIAELNSGTTTIPDNSLFQDSVDLLDLMVQQGNANALTTDYNAFIAAFGSGQAAMIQSGNWALPLIKELDPDINVGMMPIPINDDRELNDRLFVSVPVSWVINKNSAVKEEAKEFLNWLASSEAGQRYITTEFKFIPAFKNVEVNAEAVGTLGEDISRYMQEDKVLSWHWPKFPDGSPQELTIPYQKYIAGDSSKEQLLSELQNTWTTMSK